MNKTRFPRTNLTPDCVQYCLFSPTKMDLRSLILLLNKIQETKTGKRYIKNNDLLRLTSVSELQKSSILKSFAPYPPFSCVTENQVLIRERNKLVLIDITTRSIFQTLYDVMSGFGWGLLTVSIDCELFYISKKYSMFKLFNQTKTITKFLKITDLPRHLQIVYCNLSAGDLLVGMKILDSNKNEITTVVARFHVLNNMIANLISTMLTPEHDMYPAIFRDPNYITENNLRLLAWRSGD